MNSERTSVRDRRPGSEAGDRHQFIHARRARVPKVPRAHVPRTACIRPDNGRPGGDEACI